MAKEIEAKFRVADFRAVRRRLRAVGAVYRGTAIESDAFFDTPQLSINRAGRGLRLRRVRMVRSVAGGRKSGWLLTVKGPKQRNSRVKVRQEIQTAVADGQAAAEILAAAGLVQMTVLEKRRTSYKLGLCCIELDEVPRLGRFVEIEGPNQRAVEAARKKLDLPDEPITDSYLKLIGERVRPGRRR